MAYNDPDAGERREGGERVHVAQIADPSTASAADVANRLNELITMLIDNGEVG